MSDSEYSNSESDSGYESDYDNYEDEDNEDEDSEIPQNEEEKNSSDRFVKKQIVFAGGLSSTRLAMSEIVHLVSALAQTIENGRKHECDISLIKYPEITTVDLAIAEIRQKKCPYNIMREHLGGVCEIIDPNTCTFNEQDIKEDYIHNTKKNF